MQTSQQLTVIPEWAKGMQELNACMGLNLDVPTVNIPESVVNVAPANPAVNVSQNVQLLQDSTVSVEQTDISGLSNVLTGIEEQLGAVVSRDVEVRPPAVQQQSPSSPLLIQHTQNQAVMNGQATVQAQSQSTERPVKVDNHVDVKVESRPVEIMLDGEKVGSAALQWVERQNLRSGVSAFEE